MSFLPQENATVNALVASTSVEDWDTVQSEDNFQWQGSVPAYVVDTLQTVYSEGEGASKRIRNTMVYVTAEWAKTAGVQEGWSIVFTVNGTRHARQIMEVNMPIVPESGPLAFTGVAATLHLNPDPIEF